MDEKRLQEIEARVKAATAGPWRASHRRWGETEYDDESCGLGLEIEGPPEPQLRGQYARSADAIFIANARTDVPDLLAEVRRLRDECDRLRPIIDHFLRGGYLHPDQIAALLRAGKAEETSGE